ncbi:MAG: response regulator transcription factor [Gammaproteobacteria bacterium]|nr:response regulator transcription factor [Gammaproteobacteria bacterium]
MRILIVDDEKPARDRLQRLVNSLDGFKFVGEAASGREAIDRYNELKPEIVLLDIRMPLMDGLQVARHLTTDETPPAIIFTTAYSDHALEAFETHAVDYLLKPVRKERLLLALQSAQRNTRAQIQAVTQIDSQTETARKDICVRHRGNLLLIPVENIFCFNASDKYVTIYHKDGEALTEESLLHLEQEFKQKFLRIHRNALIAIDRIAGMRKHDNGKTVICFRGSDLQFEVSRRHLPTLRQFIKNS